MEVTKVTIVSSCLIIALISSIPDLITCTGDSPQDYLAAHNPARLKVGEKPLIWNATLAAYAKAYATKRRDCALIKSKGPYGENIAIAPQRSTARDIVGKWVKGGENYDTQILNGCMDPDNDIECEHYTQVVWNRTRSVGCARTACNKRSLTFVICSYYPRPVEGRIPFIPKEIF